jgi:hypothetical protein
LRTIALGLVVGALAAASAVAGTARATDIASSCGAAPYSYAGVIGRRPARGIMATLEATVGPRIAHGHVAAWVGVGGAGLGPGRTNEWLQVGLAATESASTELYYELAVPNRAPRFIALRGLVTIGRPHRIGVVEMKARPNWWRVWLDGRPITRPIELRASHDRWVPVATSESWNGGVPSCNAFAYAFRNIRWSTGSRNSWRPLVHARPISAPGYAVRVTAFAGLIVSGGTQLPTVVAVTRTTSIPTLS